MKQTPPLKIAVIDDNESVRQSYARLFELEGNTTGTFGSGEEFLASNTTDYDLIISDCQLQGMSGCDIVKQLRHDAIQTPIVLMSGVPDDDAEALAKSCSNVIALPKHCRVEEFLNAAKALAANDALIT